MINADKKKGIDKNPSDKVSKGDEETPSTIEEAEVEKKNEKFKPKPMVGLFPLDLRSELKSRIGGGKAGFSLKKSTTNVDIGIRNMEKSEPVHIKPSEIRNSMSFDPVKPMEVHNRVQVDSDDEDGGQEKLSFKEKLQLIERSSSRSVVNLL